MPWLTFAKLSIVEGSLPLWTPYETVGRPLFACIETGLLYPPNWVIFLVDIPRAMGIIQLINISIGLGGMALFLRYLRLQWPAILLALAIFARPMSSRAFYLPAGATLPPENVLRLARTVQGLHQIVPSAPSQLHRA